MIRKTNPERFLRTVIVWILSGCFAVSVNANNRLATKVEIGRFLNSTTCVVTEGGMLAFNIYIRDAVTDNWEITEYEFIDREEFEARRQDPAYSFLMLVSGTYEDDPMGVSYDFISLVLGNEEGEIADMPELASIPVSYSGDAENDYGYALPAIVKFFQHHVRKLQERRWLLSIFNLGFYNFGNDFEEMTLLLHENMMAPSVDTREEIEQVYPHEFQLVSYEEIREKVSEEADSTLFLFRVGPSGETGAGRSFEMIFDTKGRLYYYRSRDVTNENPDGFSERDFRRIS